MGQELKPTPPAPFVVDGAAIGCCYAQSGSKTKYKELWDKRHLSIEHNDSEKQCGLEMAHNYDCVPVKNVPKFEICKSPFYYETVGTLKTLYPDNEDYAKGFETYCRINAKAEGGSPPCVGAFLDTWFNASDIVISGEYQRFINNTLFFLASMREKIEKINQWGMKQIKKKKERLGEEDKRFAANPNNASRYTDTATLDEKEYYKYKTAEGKMKAVYEESKEKIICWEEYLDIIQIYEGDYCGTLEKLAKEIEEYRNKWEKILSDADISVNSEEASAFFNYCEKIASDAKKLASDATEAKDRKKCYALLTSSFLICKCGGKIEFLDSGQENVLYCHTLYKEFEKLLENALAYQEEILMQNGIYAGVEAWESNFSVKVVRWTLQEILDGFKSGREFKLNILAAAVRIRFISRSYNEELEKMLDEVVGILFIGGISQVLAGIPQIGTILENAVSLGSTIGDTKDIFEQTEIEQEKNKLDDAVTLGSEWGEHLNNLVSGMLNYKPVKKMIGKTPAKICDVAGNALTAIGWINSIGAMFYTSDENWIEEIEITVFTKYMAHVIRQSYNEDMTPRKPFNGQTMVRAKSKRDYICDSVGNIDWDELEGIMFGIAEHAIGEEISSKIEKGNEIKEDSERYYK